jgi:Protein of unknown function (DUF2652)/Polyketide cyclase / dehydrase and lipid transport
MIQQGYLVLADISGYTAFLTQLELEHSREILDQLLEVLVKQFGPPLVISKLEGDAVFAYAPQGSFMQGQTVLEAIERVYFAFRLARDNIHRTCGCQACTLTSTLDLKVVVHYGEFTIQQLGKLKELQGADVIVPHRLLKNEIARKTGISTYAFLTEKTAEAGALGELTSHMIPHSETYEHIGEVRGYVYDLAQVWERDRERRRIYIHPDEAWATLEFDLPVPPALAWDYLNNPQCICEWCHMKTVELTSLKWGRLGIGSGRYCVHAKGKAVTVETILDYQPFDYVTVQSQEPSGMIMQMMTEIVPAPDGSHIVWRAGRPTGKDSVRSLAARALITFMKGEMVNELKGMAEGIRQMVEADRAAGGLSVLDRRTQA